MLEPGFGEDAERGGRLEYNLDADSRVSRSSILGNKLYLPVFEFSLLGTIPARDAASSMRFLGTLPTTIEKMIISNGKETTEQVTRKTMSKSFVSFGLINCIGGIVK